MKKLLAVLLCLALCLPGLCAYAEEPEQEPETFLSGDFSYVILEDGTTEITAYSGLVFSKNCGRFLSSRP